MPADILIYAIVAAGLVFWLRNILGTKHGDETQRPNPLATHSDTSGSSSGSAGIGTHATGLASEHLESMSESLGRNMSIDGDLAHKGLLEIVTADRRFDLLNFMIGAQEAFAIIVEAFAAGDKETLQNLLSEQLYGSFEKAIKERDKNGETASMEIHAVRKADIVDARMVGRTAYITVRFTADETSVIRDKDNKVISGNPDKVAETIDIWTFGRHVKSRDPAWLVYETREAEDDPVPGSHVPEGKSS